MMVRIALCAAAALAMATPSLAASQKQKEGCAATAKIVAYAVDARAKGSNAKKIKRQLTRGANKVDAKYEPAVGPLVDWVFTIEPGKLNGDVAPAFEETCVGFKN